mgnify:FL=1
MDYSLIFNQPEDIKSSDSINSYYVFYMSDKFVSITHMIDRKIYTLRGNDDHHLWKKKKRC